MPAPTRVAVVVGSLRKESFNRKLALAIKATAPASMTLDIVEIGQLPLYNQDDDANPPAASVAFKEQIAAAGAVLFVTPEYNRSVPGVLKNAIDWVSRPPEPPFDGKPVAIMGAATGLLGTARAQYDLRKMFVFMNGHVLNKPEVMIGQAATRFDAEGRLTDATTRDLIVAQLGALRDWTRRLNG